MKKETDLIVRAVAFPVVEPVGSTWDAFGEACRSAWQDATALANWAATELAKHDLRRKPADKKLKAMPPLYLYGHAKKKYWGWRAWEGCYASAQSLMRGVEKKYRKERFQLLWTGERSLPTFRYPHPYPVHNACWSVEMVDGKPAVCCKLRGIDWTLRLRSNPDMGRQLALFRMILDGAKKGELSIYRQGFREKHTMVKMVAWFPKPAAKSGHTILVRTDPNAFWVAEAEGRQPWILNADHVRRWIEAHRCYLQRISEDTKYEKRWPEQMRTNINKARALRCEKQENRIDTWAHTASAMLVQWCLRQGAGEVIYDDACQGYLPSFPWHGLKTKLAYKLQAAGVALTFGAKEVA